MAKLFIDAAWRMAKSKFEYVKHFEATDRCLQNCWIVVRLDGKGFSKFSDSHCFEKPNDGRALALMNCAAQKVMADFKDIVLAYGQSDEYSFVFRRTTETYNRRASKLMTTTASLFTSAYVYHWTEFFGDSQRLLYPPSFDGRVVLYPTDQNLKDYLSWRQADCHINNLYNTCFWKLVLEGGMTQRDAEKRLQGTDSGAKNELLFSEFKTNYNNLPEIYRKGSVIVREEKLEPDAPAAAADEKETGPRSAGEGTAAARGKNRASSTRVKHVDVIRDGFWTEHPRILGS